MTDCGCTNLSVNPSYICKTPNYASTQKRVIKTVRVSESEYMMNLAAFSTYVRPCLNRTYNYVNWNQMSDRLVPSIVKVNVPTNGSSTKHSVTSLRPGSTSAPGAGVDVKHGSYERRLLRLKGNILLNFNKPYGYGIANSSNCL